ncbi:4-hydroxy-tetrahydrodipicolinate synthase [Planctomycetota bacterium]
MNIEKKNDFKGVFAALVTPMTVQGEIDLDTLSNFVEYQICQGVHGLIPLGSTGEFYALSPQERRDVLKTTIDAAAGQVAVLAGTNAGSTREVVSYCRQAEEMGASGVLLAPPYYSLPTLGELFEHFRAVNNAIGVPVMLYNYPGRTGVDMTPDFVERLTELENIQYIKESTGDITRVSELLQRCGDRLQVFCGCDTVALESFMLGAVGWVGGIVNVLPKSHVKLYELAVVQQDIPAARRLYYDILPSLRLIEGGGKYTQLVKDGCGVMGHPVGPPREPLLPAKGQELQDLKQIIDTCKKYEAS